MIIFILCVGIVWPSCGVRWVQNQCWGNVGVAGCVWEGGTQDPGSSPAPGMAGLPPHLGAARTSGSHLQWGGPVSITAGFEKRLE